MIRNFFPKGSYLIQEKFGRVTDTVNRIVHSETLSIVTILVIKILFQLIVSLSGYYWLSSDDFCRTVKSFEWLQKPEISSGVWLSPHYWVNGFVMIFIKDLFLAASTTNFIFSAFTAIYFFKLIDKVADRKTAYISSLVFVFFPFQVWLSISGLPESVYFFFVIAGVYYFILWRQDSRKYKFVFFSALMFAFSNMFRYEGWLFSITFVILTAYASFTDYGFGKRFRIHVLISLVSLLTIIWWLLLNLKDTGNMFAFAIETNKIYEDIGAAKMLQRAVQYPVFIFYIAPVTSILALKIVWECIKNLIKSRFIGNVSLLNLFILFNIIELLLLMFQGLIGTGGTNMISRYIVINALLFVPLSVIQIFRFSKTAASLLFTVIIIGNIIWSFYYPVPFREDTYETGKLIRNRIEKNFIKAPEKVYFEEVEGYYDVFAVQTVSNNPSHFILGSLPAEFHPPDKSKRKKSDKTPEELNILDIKSFFEKNSIVLAVVKSDGYAEKLRKMKFKNEEIGDYKIFYIKDIESNINDSAITLFSESVPDMKDNPDLINFNKTLAIKDFSVDNTNFGFNPQTVTINWMTVSKNILDSIDYDNLGFDRYSAVIEIRTEEKDSVVYRENRRIFSERNIEDLIENNRVRNIIVIKPFALIYYSKRTSSFPFESGVYNLYVKVHDSKRNKDLIVYRGDSLYTPELPDSLKTKNPQDSIKTKSRQEHLLQKPKYQNAYNLGNIIAFFPNTNLEKIVTKTGVSFYRIITRNGLQVFFSQRYQADNFLNYVFTYF